MPRTKRTTRNSEMLTRMDAYWRAANYLSVGQIYLYDNPLPYIVNDQIQAFNTPPENRSAEQLQSIQLSDSLFNEVIEADTIVIGAPMYNFGIPAALKTWIDHLARAGVSFTYTENGPVGLIKDKKVFLAIATA